MKREISQEQIQNEIDAGYKPIAMESGLTILPLSDLSDRDFELLVHCLIKQEIEDGEISNYTNIAIMQGVSERGRDCVLYKDGKVAGLVQCKKYQGRLTRPLVLREIIKFLLFATLDKTILPDPGSFEYKIYVSSDLTEPAIALVYGFTVEIEKEIKSGNISEYLSAVIKEYESFSKYIGAPPTAEIETLLKSIKISSSNGIDITRRLYKYDSLLNSFFKIKLVISLDAGNEMLRTALNDYGLKMLTDQDLKTLQARIGNTSEENRVNLGYLDFFGFNKGFFKYLKGKPFAELMSAVTNLKTTIDKELLNYMNSEIHESIFSRITFQLLMTGKIHPFSVGIAAPYLFNRVSRNMFSRTMPESIFLKMNPEARLSKQEQIQQISETLFESSARVMNGDYSHLAGNAEDIEYKKRIYEHMHQGFSSINDARDALKRDMVVLMPVLEEIEENLSKLVSMEQTIVIKDASFFDNKDELARMIATIKVIDEIA